MQWRIYYDDGSTFDSSQGIPEQAAGMGVQAVVQKDQLYGRSIRTRYDYYWFDERAGEWFGGDLIGLTDYLLRIGKLKLGRYIPNSAYNDILQKAQNDPQFPTKPAENGVSGSCIEHDPRNFYQEGINPSTTVA